MGGYLHEKDRRLRAERNGHDKAQRAFPHLHQSAGAGDVPAGDYRLSYRRYDKPRRTGEKRAFPFPCAHYPARRNDRTARRLCTQRAVGRLGAGYSATGQSQQGENACRYQRGTQDVSRYALAGRQVQQRREQQGFYLRTDNLRLLPAFDRQPGHAVRLQRPFHLQAERVEHL